VSEKPELRASDSDRERAAADIREAYAATTLSQLEDLRRDLPDARPLPAVTTARGLARRRILQDAGAVVILDAGCVVVWAATGASGSFWPLWVILVSALRLARDAWRLLGPAAEDGTSAGAAQGGQGR
jgi:hypothetical protein